MYSMYFLSQTTYSKYDITQGVSFEIGSLIALVTIYLLLTDGGICPGHGGLAGYRW